MGAQLASLFAASADPRFRAHPTVCPNTRLSPQAFRGSRPHSAPVPVYARPPDRQAEVPENREAVRRDRRRFAHLEVDSDPGQGHGRTSRRAVPRDGAAQGVHHVPLRRAVDGNVPRRDAARRRHAGRRIHAIPAVLVLDHGQQLERVVEADSRAGRIGEAEGQGGHGRSGPGRRNRMERH